MGAEFAPKADVLSVRVAHLKAVVYVERETGELFVPYRCQRPVNYSSLAPEGRHHSLQHTQKAFMGARQEACVMGASAFVMGAEACVFAAVNARGAPSQ